MTTKKSKTTTASSKKSKTSVKARKAAADPSTLKGEAETTNVVGKTAAKARKAAAKEPVDTRVVTMHGETRLTHHGDGEAALTALLPTIDAVNGGGRVTVTSAAHGADGVHIHVVPAGHVKPYETNPGVILTIGGNGHAAFDHVSLGLATQSLIEEVTLGVITAVKPNEGEEPAEGGRRAGWFREACNAAEAIAGQFAS